MRLRALCQSLLLLNLAYCTAALFSDALPGWKMFETVEPLSYRLLDGQGRSIDVRTYLPRYAYLIDQHQLRRVVQFVRTKEAGRGPFRFEIDGVAQP
jgi:hypothetical protein